MDLFENHFDHLTYLMGNKLQYFKIFIVYNYIQLFKKKTFESKVNSLKGLNSCYEGLFIQKDSL